MKKFFAFLLLLSPILVFSQDETPDTMLTQDFFQFECKIISLEINPTPVQDQVTAFAHAIVEENGRTVDLYKLCGQLLERTAETKLLSNCIISGQTKDYKSTFSQAKLLYEQSNSCLWLHVFQGVDKDYYYVKAHNMEELTSFFKPQK